MSKKESWPRKPAIIENAEIADRELYDLIVNCIQNPQPGEEQSVLEKLRDMPLEAIKPFIHANLLTMDGKRNITINHGLPADLNLNQLCRTRIRAEKSLGKEDPEQGAELKAIFAQVVSSVREYLEKQGNNDDVNRMRQELKRILENFLPRKRTRIGRGMYLVGIMNQGEEIMFPDMTYYIGDNEVQGLRVEHNQNQNSVTPFKKVQIGDIVLVQFGGVPRRDIDRAFCIYCDVVPNKMTGFLPEEYQTEVLFNQERNSRLIALDKYKLDRKAERQSSGIRPTHWWEE